MNKGTLANFKITPGNVRLEPPATAVSPDIDVVVAFGRCHADSCCCCRRRRTFPLGQVRIALETVQHTQHTRPRVHSRFFLLRLFSRRLSSSSLSPCSCHVFPNWSPLSPAVHSVGTQTSNNSTRDQFDPTSRNLRRTYLVHLRNTLLTD